MAQRQLRLAIVEIRIYWRKFAMCHTRALNVSLGRKSVYGRYRTSKALGATAGFWLNLQTPFDVATAEKAFGKALAKIVPISKDAA